MSYLIYKSLICTCLGIENGACLMGAIKNNLVWSGRPARAYTHILVQSTTTYGISYKQPYSLLCLSAC